MGRRRHKRELILVYLSPFDCSTIDLPVPVADTVLYAAISPGISGITTDSHQTVKLMEYEECGTLRCKRGMPEKAALGREDASPGMIAIVGGRERAEIGILSKDPRSGSHCRSMSSKYIQLETKL